MVVAVLRRPHGEAVGQGRQMAQAPDMIAGFPCRMTLLGAGRTDDFLQELRGLFQVFFL